MLTEKRHSAILSALFLCFALVTSGGFAGTVAAAPAKPSQRLLIDTVSGAGHNTLRTDLEKQGYSIAIDLPQINLLVVNSSSTGNFRSALTADSRVRTVAADHISALASPEQQADLFGKPPGANPTITRFPINVAGIPPNKLPAVTITPDPTFFLPRLMWNVSRIKAPAAWSLQNGLGLGFQSIKVGVVDTGLDYTHLELRNKVDSGVDLTLNEQPNICSTVFGDPTDEQLAIAFGAPSSDLDFNGHGTWVGGNIAAALNMTGTNGIAPHVQLVSLKIAQNCGSAYDSNIIDAIAYAADHGIDVVSISFANYLDRASPDQNTIYQFYERVVNYAWKHGTIIIAAAGDDHTRIGAGGQVISHGVLSLPPGGTDYFGRWEYPGGIPNVVDVSSTGNVVKASSPTCPSDSLAAGSHQWCKLSSDPHQPTGMGKKNQLTYYSNYGPRINLSAPGGSRKFNLPEYDNGGCEGWPWCGQNSVEGGTSSSDGYNAWQDFSITSDYATKIPCFTFSGSPTFPNNQCYAIIQGSAMAMSHVAAVAAQVLSTHPAAYKNPGLLKTLLLGGAHHLGGNTTPGLSKTDTSSGDLGGGACSGGYCHLGGTAISNTDAYGSGGFIDSFRSVSAP